MKEAKKHFTETQVITTTFLKNCVKIPKKEIISETNDQEGVSMKQYVEELNNYKQIAFKRGSMLFEDFNYKFFNKYIIQIDPDVNNKDILEEEFPGGFIPSPALKSLKKGD